MSNRECRTCLETHLRRTLLCLFWKWQLQRLLVRFGCEWGCLRVSHIILCTIQSQHYDWSEQESRVSKIALCYHVHNNLCMKIHVTWRGVTNVSVCKIILITVLVFSFFLVFFPTPPLKQINQQQWTSSKVTYTPLSTILLYIIYLFVYLSLLWGWGDFSTFLSHPNFPSRLLPLPFSHHFAHFSISFPFLLGPGCPQGVWDRLGDFLYVPLSWPELPSWGSFDGVGDYSSLFIGLYTTVTQQQQQQQHMHTSHTDTHMQASPYSPVFTHSFDTLVPKCIINDFWHLKMVKSSSNV